MFRLASIAALTAACAIFAASSAWAADPVPTQQPAFKAPSPAPPPPPDPPPTVTTAETIDVEKFGSYIRNELDGRAVGFSYAIARNGAVIRSGAGGFRRLAQDGAPAAFTDATMSQALSTSKLVTAAALLKALHERGLSPETKIVSYLPRCWEKGPNVDRLTFRDVLGHHTMLPEGSEDDPLLRLINMVAKGRPARRKGETPYSYNNTVYGLPRVLLPFVRSRRELQRRFGFSTSRCKSRTEELNKLVSDRFRDYVLKKMLAPLGATASFYPQGDGVEDWAALYNNADWSQPGSGPGEDFHLRAGAGYLAIGARSYARFLSALDAGLIVPKALAEQMKGTPGDRMGFDTSISGDLGEYVWKNGGVGGGSKPGGKALAMVFPNGMQAYVAVNSSNNTYGSSLQSILRTAFDEALL